MDFLFTKSPPNISRWVALDYWPATSSGPDERCWINDFEREVAVEPPGPPVEGGPYECLARALMKHDIFPASVATGALERGGLEEGATVGIRYCSFPFVDLFFAARVFEVFDGVEGNVWRTGFRYRTLVGHPQLGEAIFSVEKHSESGRVMVNLSSWSRQGTWLAKVLSPIVRYLQVKALRDALMNLQELASSQAPWGEFDRTFPPLLKRIGIRMNFAHLTRAAIPFLHP